MRTAFSYYGGKSQLAPIISKYIPDDLDMYIEPFFGSGALFFYRARWARQEVINDINGDIVNFFRVLRDKPAALQKKLALTLHSRQELRESTKRMNAAKTDVMRAVYFFVRANQSFGSNQRANGGWLFDGINKKRALTWRRKTSTQFIDKLSARLSNVSIENNPALELMRLYDHPRAFFYLDPPYLSVKSMADKSRSYNGHDMLEADHATFIEHCLSMKSQIIISGYDHAAYDALVSNGWRKISIPWFNPSSQKESSEILWISPNISLNSQMQLL